MREEMTLDSEIRHGHKIGDIDMKFKSIYFVVCAAITLVATSCVEENFEKNKVGFTNDPNAVCFGVTSRDVEAKTVYGEQDESKNWPLYWTKGDKIDIYCPQAEDITSASYTVYNSVTIDAEGNVTTADSDGSTHQGQINPSTDAYLKWGGDDGAHNFYAVYPSGVATFSSETEGYATFKINSDQVCTINSSTTNANSGVDYIAAPDMNNAYMVASAENQQPSTDAVSLDFTPIMTTLLVKVSSPQSAVDYKTTITGISVTSTISSVDAQSGVFTYDLNKKTRGIVLGAQGDPIEATTFVSVKNGDVNYIDLDEYSSVTFTVFLPPIPVNSSNPIRIRVHTAGGELSAFLGTAAPTENRPKNSVFNADVDIKASTIRRVILPSIPTPLPEGNDWITPLDDKIYVSQLSIPGTHDAAASHTSMKLATTPLLSIGSGAVESVIGEVGLTQAISIEEQWDLGIRAFDLRPAYSNFDSWLSGDLIGLVIWHGLVVCTDGKGDNPENAITLSGVIDMLLTKMEGTQEFAIILMRHEDETGVALGVNFTAKDTGAWSDAMGTYLKGLIDEKKALMYKPDLTLGEAAGKILFLSRDTYTGGPYGGYVRSWPHNSMVDLNATPSYIEDDAGNSKDDTDGTLYAQDYYENVNTGTKTSYITQMLDLSTTAHTNPNLLYSWFINHASGYTGGSSTSAGYRENAGVQNLAFFNYLTAEDYVPGPTGIVLMDYVGSRTFSGDTVYGDLGPQAIIDNNYKYVLKRSTK